MGQATANVIFTEYVEGSSSNKAIEITNFGATSVDLSEVSIVLTHPGENHNDQKIHKLSGTLAAESSYVLTNSSANDALKAFSNIMSNTTNFNGDDSLRLLYKGKVVDSFGQDAFDPGKKWGSGDTSTSDRTLRRKTGITVGDTVYDDTFIPSSEWVGFAKDTFDGLGCAGVAACNGDGNIPSQISGAAKTVVNAQTRYDFTPTVTNLDNDLLTFTIENKPTWAEFDSKTGTLSGDITVDDIGNYTDIVIVVNDGTSSAALASFSILVRPAGTNDVPQITGTPVLSIQATRSYKFAPSVTDSENDSLVFSIENKPSWAVFDIQSGQLSGIPNEAQVGVYTDITISVSDGHNTAQSLPSFSISVTDKPGSNYDYNQYYASAIGKVGSELEQALSLIARQGHQKMTYSQVWDALKYSDEDPQNTDNVILFYSGRSKSKNEHGDGKTDWNREHSWPKSHGLDTEKKFGYTDIHHVRPTDSQVNSTRGSKDYGMGGSPVSGAPGNFSSDDSFEPRDAVKGDTARMMFYMAVRYDGTDGNMPDLELVNTVSVSKSPTLGVLCNLMQWHRQDPIDALERERHHRIVEKQGNRNPFVDNGEFAELLFGNTCPKIGPTAPVIGGEPVTMIGAGSLYRFVPSASDVNRDALTFSIKNKPNWAAFNSATGALTGTPKVTDIATYRDIQILVSDGVLSAHLAAFDIDVVDPTTIKYPPTLSGVPNSGVLINQDYRFVPVAHDKNNDSLTFSIVNKPSWATFDRLTGELSGTPTKTDEGLHSAIIISVTDGHGAAVELAPFSILVSNDRPVNNVIFTEYIEGSSNNKAIEITNFSGSSLDLSRVKIILARNGAPLSTDKLPTQTLSGVLADKASYVITNSDANDEIKGHQNSTSKVTYFNGDDALVLMVDNKITDVFGQLGVDPGSYWGSGQTSTKDKTLRRKDGITVGDVNGEDVFNPSAQWQGFAKDVADGLGCSGTAACGSNEPSPIELGKCGEGATLISAIQGDNDTSPFVDKNVVVEGIVVASYQGAGQHGGFFVQEEDAQKDTNTATSEGIFVAHTATKVNVGQQVRFTAQVAEKHGLTQLYNAANITTCATNVLNKVTPTSVNLPFAENFMQESLEGMWVTLPQNLHVTLSHNFTKYGEILLSNGQRIQPTNKYAKDDPQRQALAELNARNVLVVDDNSSQRNPQSISYFPQFSAKTPLRSGAKVTDFSGVLHFAYQKYRLLPTSVPVFEHVNARPSKPFSRKSPSHIRVASFNVLNYFLDFNGRGANNENEFKRQRSKIIRAITAMDADVVGLMEIENSGFGRSSAIQNLIDGLNDRDQQHTWQFIEPQLDKVGSDAVTVGIIYRSNRVQPIGIPTVITDAPFDEQTKAHRPPMIQSFKPINGGKEIKVVVNHFRSKGGSCGAEMDDDVQGKCNGQRVLASKTLLKHLGKTAQFIPSNLNANRVSRNSVQDNDEPILAILGDFNAYAYEDPMLEFYNAGFTNLSIAKGKGDNYSYYYAGVAGSLDHLLTATTSLNSVEQVMHWHINADEAKALDYNTEDKTDTQKTKWFGETPYRSSDHDPVIADFDLKAVSLPVNQAPVANDDKAQSSQGEAVSINVLANDFDSDGNTLVITSATVSKEVGSVTWSGANIVFTPNADFVGVASINYVINDGVNGEAAGTLAVTVTAKNQAPVAKDDSVTTAEDNAITVPVIANDTDDNTAVLKISAATLLSGKGTVTHSASSLTYTPTADFNGMAKVSYTIEDSQGATSSAIVTITVTPVNDAPVLNDDIALGSARKTTVIDVLRNDTDIDNDTLNITSASADVGTVSISNNTLIYQAPQLNTGSATLNYTVSDGVVTGSAKVRVTINTKNVSPVAEDDVFELSSNENAAFISVLENDFDADNDALTLIAVSSDVGSTVIVDNTIHFTTTETFKGSAQVRYVISDGFGGRDEGVLEIKQQQNSAPTITVPNPITVNATGAFTQVDLGIATATNAAGNPIAVTREGSEYLQSGLNRIYWQACNNEVCDTVAQRVNVKPLIGFASPSQVVLEGNKAVIPVVLSGAHFEYPVTLKYSISGTASSDDFVSPQGELVISQGTHGVIEIDVLNDTLADTDESIVVTLQSDEQNLSHQTHHEILISESNLAPVLTLSTMQADQLRTTMSQQDGNILIKALVTDQNPNDAHTINWQLPDGVVNHSQQPDVLNIDPQTFALGTYQFDATVTDEGGLQDTQSVFLKLIAQMPTLDEAKDTDGDLINDAIEGVADDDGDGIANYLDPFDSQCNVLPTQQNEWHSGLIETDAGVCMSLGSASLGAASALLNEDQITLDTDMKNQGGIFDFVVTTVSGMSSVKVVLPQQAAIPANAQYRKYLPEQGWITFVEENGNALHSAMGQQGYCPAINDASWQTGLIEGAWCVRLTLVDGGQYDADGAKNGKIVDPGGVAVAVSDNQAPVAADDILTLLQNTQAVVSVLNNDIDADNDVLYVINAHAELGNVQINSDSTLLYESAVDFIGTDMVSYTISDGQGATANAQVTVTVSAKVNEENHAPIAHSDSVTVFNDESSVIDVLKNDIDPNNDALSLVSATASSGAVTVQAGHIQYQPVAGSEGQVIITYVVADEHGMQSTGKVFVTIKARSVLEPNHAKQSSSGGSMPVLLYVLLIPTLMRRLRR
jgi:predicted extracellular nuclease/endonuclease I